MRYIDTDRGEIPNFKDPDLDAKMQFVHLKMDGLVRVENLSGDMIRGFSDL